jgi:arginine/serine-rich splicing factor 17
MNQIHPCKDDSELTPLYPSRGLFLKPIARINVSVHYPELKASLSTGAKSVSSWDIMERIKALVAPETFVSLRVVKNTLEFIRFEGDLENRTVLKKIIQRLDGWCTTRLKNGVDDFVILLERRGNNYCFGVF